MNGNLNVKKEDDDLMRIRREYKDQEDFGEDDDSEGGNLHLDDPELVSDDEWDENGGSLTPSNLSNY